MGAAGGNPASLAEEYLVMHQLSVGRQSLTAASAIGTLDLAMIEQRLLKRGWSAVRTERAITDYRLFLQEVSGGATPQPANDVDEVWHDHILHTKRYARDCEAIFGTFLHHDPDEGRPHLCVPSVDRALCVPSVSLCVPSIDKDVAVH